MPFSYSRTIRFHETDGAGVVYFATVLSLCHEAYEASLEAAGVEMREFFSPVGIVVPVVHASVDFFRPLHCGDRLSISLQPALLSEESFEIHYKISQAQSEEQAAEAARPPRPWVRALTRHVCIQVDPRQRQPLPPSLRQRLKLLET